MNPGKLKNVQIAGLGRFTDVDRRAVIEISASFMVGTQGTLSEGQWERGLKILYII